MPTQVVRERGGHSIRARAGWAFKSGDAAGLTYRLWFGKHKFPKGAGRTAHQCWPRAVPLKKCSAALERKRRALLNSCKYLCNFRHKKARGVATSGLKNFCCKTKSITGCSEFLLHRQRRKGLQWGKFLLLQRRKRWQCPNHRQRRKLIERR